MPSSRPRLWTLHRKWREVRMVARGLQSASHPLLAQIVPIRRCNLACTYCNEYDKHSQPVPMATLIERLNHLARLGTANIEISGGEPPADGAVLLGPEAERFPAEPRVRARE